MFLPDVVTSGRINTHVNRTYDLASFEQCYFPDEPGCRVFTFFLALPLILGHCIYLFNCP